MEDQRNRQQRHQLIEQVIGNHTAGKYQAVQRTMHHQVETEEPALLLLVLHIFESVDTGQNPDQIHNHRKQFAQLIHMKVNVQILAKGEQQQFRFFSKHNSHCQRGSHNETHTGNGQKGISIFAFPLRQDAKAQQSRQQNG